uniref:tRNA(Ile)-lysidine synthase n=1 Tax=uncultured Thiotrichaceae bacterium TaxID=298394 RepID=A0A6S6SY15_9GAMM|nr:MAG: tRNA(Ile)-lysidine synthetase (EC [uncultured Thiotrichaceae bacterium]
MKKESNISGQLKDFESSEVFQLLLNFFRATPVNSCLVAYSGGLDSHVLLHALATLQQHSVDRPSIRAIHIDHGLQLVSGAWSMHCEAVCVELNIEFEAISLDLQVPAGSSVEAVARHARYAVFEQHLRPDEVLLTAHHQNDQAETLLLNLLRGSGPEGLAAMPVSRPFANTQLLRPLLDVSRAQLTAYAVEHQLKWIDDPSNESLAFDRNYLRHEVLPKFRERWVATDKLLARAAQWQSEAVELQNDLLADRLQHVQGTQAGTVSVSALLEGSVVLRKALLRQWIKGAGFSSPSVKKLQHILSDVLPAKPDAQPCVAWAGCEVRRYRDDLYVLEPLSAHDSQQSLYWEAPYDDYWIESLGLVLEKSSLEALLPQLIDSDEPLEIRFRQGGEKVLLRGIHVSLKQLLQDKAVPPWRRDRLPLVYTGQQLIMIPGLFVLSTGDLLM